jgi:CcmD family protein
MKETLSYLFWGYNVVWAGLAVFLVLTWTRLRRAERRLTQLERTGTN